jgi:hypothetical protein
MTEFVGVDPTSVQTRIPQPPQLGDPAGPLPEMIKAEPQPTATSAAAALEKKHTFDCAQPTRGGLCDC